MNRVVLSFALATFFLSVSDLAKATAELTLPTFFSDHMVLQREGIAPIWGTTDAGASVTVTFHGKTASGTADADGKWRVGIETGLANSNGSDLVVSSGSESHTIADVVVGEVWFASGQSNMAFTMNRVAEYQDLMSKSNHPGLRMFNAATTTAVEPQDDIAGTWTQCSPATVPSYSAVAFFFARNLHLELDIPVGVIKSAWGGKPVETFTSREALLSMEETEPMVEAVIATDAKFDREKAQAAFEARLEKWKAAVEVAKAKPADKRGRLPKRPASPKRPLNTEGKPGVLFNAMIHPFVGYAMQGAIWYQGEANAKPGAVPYDLTLPLMINDWRKRWNDDFSFYFVQLANFRQPSTEPGTPDAWALLQDRMRLIVETTPKTGVAVINDVGAANDIHPKNKRDPGERLARWALAKDYGRDVVISGPLLAGHQAGKGAIDVTFNHVGEGLKSRDGEKLKRFEIAGKDRIWHWATADITGKNTVRVSNEDVGQPVAVRYAWASNPEGANLVNSEGLPASILRTDSWDDVLQR